MKKDDKYKLYIPINIKTRIEFFEGYGFKEFGITTIAFILSSIIAMCIFKLTNEVIFSVLFVLMIVSLAIVLIVKDSSNLSFIEHIRNLIRFYKEQNKYPYKYRREWDHDK